MKLGTRRSRRLMAWAAVYVVLTFAVCLPYSAHLADRLPDDGDAVLAAWIVWWGSTHLDAGYPGILNANAYYPHPMGLAYTEPMLAQAVLGWPIMALSGNPVLVVNLLGLMALAVGAFATHLLLREWVGSDLAAFVGAVSYAFCAGSLSQLARIQLLNLGWIPLALLFMHRLLVRPSWRATVGLVGAALLNALSCFYFIVFHALASLFVFPSYLPRLRGRQGLRPLGLLLGAAIVVGGVMAWVGRPFQHLYRTYEFSGARESHDVLSALRPVPGSLVGSLVGAAGHIPSNAVPYVALALGAVGLVALWRRRGPWHGQRIGLAAVGLTGLVLSWGHELIIGGLHLGPGPAAFVSWVPLVGWLRSSERFAVLFRLGLALLVAMGVQRILRRRAPRWRPLWAVGLAVLVVGEHWTPLLTRGRLVPTGRAIPAVYGELRSLAPGSPLAELPVYPERLVRFNAMEAYLSHVHGRPVFFAKPSYIPPATEWIRSRLARFPGADSLTFLQALGVRTLVVHPRRWREIQGPGMEQRRLAQLTALDRQSDALERVETYPDREDELAERFHLGGEIVYRLAPLAVQGRPRRCDCREIDRAKLKARSLVGNDPRQAIDGLRRTRWSTERSQLQGDDLTLIFDRPRHVARIEIETSYPYDEFAHHLRVVGGLAGAWKPLTMLDDVWGDVALVRQLVAQPRLARYRYDLEAAWVDRIRLVIADASSELPPWTVAEVHVLETTGSAEEPPAVSAAPPTYSPRSDRPARLR